MHSGNMTSPLFCRGLPNDPLFFVSSLFKNSSVTRDKQNIFNKPHGICPKYKIVIKLKGKIILSSNNVKKDKSISEFESKIFLNAVKVDF